MHACQFHDPQVVYCGAINLIGVVSLKCYPYLQFLLWVGFRKNYKEIDCF